MKPISIHNNIVFCIIDLFLHSNSVEAGPPLSTILGNLGLNTTKFCKEFNDFTNMLPVYFLLKVRIYVFENRTYSFVVDICSTSFLLKLLSFEYTIKIFQLNKLRDVTLNCLNLEDLLKLSKFKFANFPISNSLPIT